MFEYIDKEEAIKRHRMLWKWIAIETLRRRIDVGKCEYFDYFGIIDIPQNYCYLCEYTKKYCIDTRCEVSCPVRWGYYNTCTYYNSLYKQWLNCEEYDYKKAALLAYKISKLPERKLTKYERKKYL